MNTTTREYCLPRKTEPRHYLVSGGKKSKNPEYLQIQDVPCRVHSYDNETFTLNSFTSSSSRLFHVTKDEFAKDFTFIYPNEESNLILQSYRNIPIHENEFERREDVSAIEKVIRSTFENENLPINLRKIFKDKLFQIIQSMGAPYITMTEYFKFKTGDVELSSHKRFGCSIFNRNSRWCPPITLTHEEFEKSPSYPAPLGIRSKDFCLPSELIETIKELIIQIVNFDGVTDEMFEELQKTMPFIEKRTKNICFYCGKKLSVEEYSSIYKSETNYMEICHRNPNERFLSTNMYWGHGDCNRRQGGYTEDERIYDGFRLAYLTGKINEETFTQLQHSLSM
jgi:hypothetical protein